MAPFLIDRLDTQRRGEMYGQGCLICCGFHCVWNLFGQRGKHPGTGIQLDDLCLEKLGRYFSRGIPNTMVSLRVHRNTKLCKNVV